MKRVYFIRRADGIGPIKIGCTSAISPRLAQLCSDYRVGLEVLADAPGNFLDERNILLKFAAHNIPFADARGKQVNEWFEPAPELLAFIATVKRAGILPLTMRDRRELQMRELYLEGATLKEIGAQFGVTRERVRQILRRTGVPSLGYRPEVSRSVVTPELEAEIIRLAEEGWTQPQIADALGVARQNVCTYLRRNEVRAIPAKRECRPETLAIAAKVATDYKSGVPTHKIAAKYGYQGPEIYRLLRIAGIKPNRLKQTKLNDIDRQRLLNAYQRGATLKQLGADFGRSTDSIHNLVAKAGLLRSREDNERIRVAAVSAANKRREAAKRAKAA